MIKKSMLILCIILSCFIVIKLTIPYFLPKEKEEEIITIVEDKPDSVISIHYPKTHIEELDRKIESDIVKQYMSFSKEYGNSDYLMDRDELNIDYQYYKTKNNYISIALTIYIDSYKLQHPTWSMITYHFDGNKNEKLQLSSFFSMEEMTKLKNKLKNTLLEQYSDCILVENLNQLFNDDFSNYPYFSFDQDNFYFYFPEEKLASDYHEMITIPIPHSELSVNIPLVFPKEEKTISISKQSPTAIDPTKPVVALTFDDGPSRYTEEILETLKKHEVCATFFVLGNKVEDYKEVLKKSIEYQNELGNHSYNHKWLSRLPINSLKEQIEKTQQILQESLSYQPKYLRPTYGSVNDRIRKNTELKIVLWTVDTKDWKIKNIDRIVEKATTDIEDGDIILMHDIFERSAKALEKIIPILKEQGFQFVTISELEEVKKIRGYIDVDN